MHNAQCAMRNVELYTVYHVRFETEFKIGGREKHQPVRISQKNPALLA